jgi:flagellar protein FlbT
VPLLIKLTPGEKIVVNGVVIENGGEHAVLRVLNQAHLLRARDILTFDEATTPARRVYYALQCLYLFPDNQKEYLESAQAYISEFLEAVPSSRGLVDEITECLSQGEMYQMLKAAKKLVEYERRILENVASHQVQSL